jgi:hypothetical protein
VLLPFLTFGIFAALLLGLEMNHRGGYISSRHALVPAAMLSLLAGPGFFTIAEWIVVLRRRMGFGPLRRATVAVCLASGILLAVLPALFSIPHEGKSIYREAARCAPKGAGKYWLSHEMILAYHAGCPIQQLRQRGDDSCLLHPRHMRSAQSLLARAQRNAHRVTYVAVPEIVLLEEVEIPISDLLRSHDRFEHVEEVSEGQTDIHVFRLLPDPSSPDR